MKRNPTRTTNIVLSYGRQLRGLINNFQTKALEIIPKAQAEYGPQIRKRGHQLIENSLIADLDRIMAGLQYSEIRLRVGPIAERYARMAYTRGGQAAVASLRRARYEVSYAYTPSDMKAVAMLIDHNLIEIQGMGDDMKKEVMRVLTQGILEGQSNYNIARAITGCIDISRNRATMIARTETIRSYNQASVDRYRQAGLEQWRWITAMDERTCEECAGNDNVIFDMGDPQPPYPHPACRCSVAPYIDENLTPTPQE